MNYLAHLALALPTDESRIGNLLGDFAKGNETSLRAKFPSEVVDGILMHRAIDKFTDGHACFAEAKALLDKKRQRFAGIIVDIIYDHFLAQHWETFYQQSLTDFSQEAYAALHRHPEWWAGRLSEVAPKMIEHNWLPAYAVETNIHFTFKRVAERGRFTAPVAKASEDLRNHYTDFEAIFLRFYPELQRFAMERSNNSGGTD